MVEEGDALKLQIDNLQQQLDVALRNTDALNAELEAVKAQVEALQRERDEDRRERGEDRERERELQRERGDTQARFAHLEQEIQVLREGAQNRNVGQVENGKLNAHESTLIYLFSTILVICKESKVYLFVVRFSCR